MALKLLLVCFACVKIGSSQYYTSSYPYSYSYPYTTSNYPATSYPVPPVASTYPPSTYPPTPVPQPSPYYTQYGKTPSKTTPTTSIAYVVKSPNKYAVNSSEKSKNTEKIAHKCPIYNCPLCDGYKNVEPNPKVPPPPPKSHEMLPITSPSLPEILEKISNIEKEALNEKKSLLSKLKDVCEKPKLKSISEKLKEKCDKVKCYRFDEDLLDGFLTGLGLGD